MDWERLAAVGVVVLASPLLAARLVDRRIARAEARPRPAPATACCGAASRRDPVRRRALGAARDPAGARGRRRRSSRLGAVLGVVIGLAAQRTLGQLHRRHPDRLHAAAADRRPRQGRRCRRHGRGDRADIYTFIRTRDDVRLVIPNEKLASDTIRNSTIRSREKLAEVTVQCAARPRSRRRRRASAPRARRGAGVFVSALDGQRDDHGARVRPNTPTRPSGSSRELRLRVHERLREHGRLRMSPRDRRRAAAGAADRSSSTPGAAPQAPARRARQAAPARKLAVLVALLVVVAARSRPRPASAARPRSARAATSAPAPGRDRPELARLRGRRLAARRDPLRAQPAARRARAR